VLALMLRHHGDQNSGSRRGPLTRRADRHRHSPNHAQAMDLIQIDRRATGRALKSRVPGAGKDRAQNGPP
jgi:hypothetical protein